MSVPVTPPTITAVVCSNRGGPGLRSAIRSIAANSRVPDEILLIAQLPPSEWHEPELRALQDQGLLRIVFDAGRGLSRARNIAIREARTTHVICTDDDCIVGPDWVSAHLDVYQRDPLVALVFGSVDPPLGGVPDGGYVPTFDLEAELGTWKTAGAAASGMGANMSFPLSTVEKAGNFDERFGVGAVLGSGEDLEFSVRVRGKGLKVVAIRRGRVIHEGGVRPKGDQSNTIWLRDGMGLGAVLYVCLRHGNWLGSGLMLRTVSRLVGEAASRVVRRQRPSGVRLAAHMVKGSLLGFAKAAKERAS